MTNSIMRNTMKKTYLMILAAGLVCLAACQKEDFSIDDMENAAITYIRANEESSTTTKASIDNTTAAFTWNTNDRVAVYADGYKISDPLADTYNGTNAATFAFSGANAVTEAERSNFAIFPASLVWDRTSIRTGSASNYTSSGLTVTLPASYTLAEVQNDVSPCPMIATNAPNGDLSFKHLCALLRVEVSNVPATTRRLVFVFNDKKVQGEFTLTGVDPGTSSIETTAASGSNNTITVFTPDIDAVSTLTINLPLPAGTYDYITIRAYDKAEGGLPTCANTRLIKKSSPGTWTSNRLSSRKISATLSQMDIAFTINKDNKKVVFAPGNLQATYTASSETWNWHFAEHQYDFIGNAGGNKLITTATKEETAPYAKLSGDGTVDLFGWSSDATYYGIATSQNSPNDNPYTGDYGGVFNDWGTMDIDGNGANYWRTMSCNLDEACEWFYLMWTRSATTINEVANARFTLAAINVDGTRVNGMILFPDNYAGPTTSTSDITFGKINEGRYKDPSWPDWGGTSCTIAGWATLESVGCVFLPAAGERKGTTVDFNSNNYASKTNNGVWAWYPMRFRSGTSQYNVYWNGTGSENKRATGASVRLVHDVN